MIILLKKRLWCTSDLQTALHKPNQNLKAESIQRQQDNRLQVSYLRSPSIHLWMDYHQAIRL